MKKMQAQNAHATDAMLDNKKRMVKKNGGVEEKKKHTARRKKKELSENKRIKRQHGKYIPAKFNKNK